VVVDDDENFRFVLALMLQMERFDVVGEASDGFAAVEVTERTQPAFVIIDTMLPGQDGEAAARLIRERAPQTRIVASSGILRATPPWADTFADKTDVAAIPALLRELGDDPPELRGRCEIPPDSGHG
jgi:CheY-like chemotaxis protein